MSTELIDPHETDTDMRFAVCYARGSVLKREGKFLRVEKGKRTLVSRSLCMTESYGDTCHGCPNFTARLTLRPTGG